MGVLQWLSADDQVKNSGKTDIDVAALFETTVLHEMTHSKAVGIPQTEMGIGEVYGWTDIVDVKSPNNSGVCCYFLTPFLCLEPLWIFRISDKKKLWKLSFGSDA